MDYNFKIIFISIVTKIYFFYFLNIQVKKLESIVNNNFNRNQKTK
jgi:hypothetical protein